LTLQLSEAVHCQIPESNASAAGLCSECELVLHAFFDGELDAAVSLACERNLGQCQGCFVEDEIEIHEMDIHAFRNGLACSYQVAKSN
jgi:anti-sigma factor RsiW